MIQLCAEQMEAALTVFMLHHLPIRSFAALRGPCHALRDIVDGAPCDILIAAVTAGRLLPSAIAERLSSSQSWQVVLGRHAAMVQRLRSGVCTSMKHLQLEADHRMSSLAWSPATQPLLAILTCQDHAAPRSNHLHLIHTSPFQQLLSPAGLPASTSIVLQAWISDKHLLCEISDRQGHAITVLNVWGGTSIEPVRMSQGQNLESATDTSADCQGHHCHIE
ncbi:hypothetical protein WJX74_010312 [Apatococcus lobatus]|uniref:Uncharacterized protein n=1 Tax=Apatococcus lobatus TaxID=904363 RepID=A0AAW1RLV8_9CHLO